LNPRPSNDSPTLDGRRRSTRRAKWWAIAVAISLVVTLTGSGVIFWAIHYGDALSPMTITLGVTLLALGLVAIIACFGFWVASATQPSSRKE
jgi:hypothetical protein